MIKTRWIRMAALLSVLGAEHVAWAHHSAAMFDHTRTVEVEGVVKSFLWTNPHTLLIVTVKSPSGEKDLSFEADGPAYLMRNGWKRDSIQSGDVVTVIMNPLHDGGPGGKLVAVTSADGRELSALISVAPPEARDAEPQR
jgi:hypothetical protein